MKFFICRRICTETGFTLVETLVAISILLLAVVAPMVFIANDIAAVLSTKDKITALYLAEDAIDFVKYRIMTNMSNGQFWLDEIPDGNVGSCAISGGNGCMADSFNDTICGADSICPSVPLKFNSADGVYSYGSGTMSKFTRTVFVNGAPNGPNVSGPDEVIIMARVTWDYKGVQKKVEISENAFVWGS